MHHPPASPDHDLLFDLPSIEMEVRAEPLFRERGHAARTLVKSRDLVVVLMAMKAGSHIVEHRAKQTATIYLRSGRVSLGLPERTVSLGPGDLLVLPLAIPHDVTAQEDSVILLTLGKTG